MPSESGTFLFLKQQSRLPMLILLNKPCGVLCQFSADGSQKPTLKDYVSQPNVYPAGRLDTASEGLLLLTDDGALQAHITHPRHKWPKIYWAQVEGVPSQAELAAFALPMDLGDFVSLPALARLMAPPAALWPRSPPIRTRAAIPTQWVEITLVEGKNHQVRRMTAKLGFPTLRLIRWAVGDYDLQGLGPGDWRIIPPNELLQIHHDFAKIRSTT